MKELKIGQRVLGFSDGEATIIAKSLDCNGEVEKYKIKYDGMMGRTEWRYANMVNEIVSDEV